MPKKTLHDLIAPDKVQSDGRVPHIFHRHGAVEIHADVIRGPDQVLIATETETQRMTAYGIIAAGDVMVPYNAPANVSMLHALRTAVSTRLMSDIGAFDSPPALFKSEGIKTVYYHAIEAMRHYGTSNQESILKAAQHWIKEYGLSYQAEILEPLIRTAVNMAMNHRKDDLEWFYKEFHALYGSEMKPNPGKPNPPPVPKEEPFAIPLEFPAEGGKPEIKDGLGWGKIESIQRVLMKAWAHPVIRSKSFWKYSEFGVFKYPWRALPSSDYRCFSLRRKKYGGTILVDMSGSMQIDQSELEKILHIAPHATIAGYSSTAGDTTMQTGRIVIIAEDQKKGKAAAARTLLGGGNVIDGPALQWLAQQEKPRIWVSDGVVTGAGEAQTSALINDAVLLQAAGTIMRIPTLGSLIKQLS